MERNMFWLFMDVNKIQFPAELLSSGLESASFPDSSRGCSRLWPYQTFPRFGVKGQSW